MQLTPEDHSRIAAAIARAESATSGELFCVLARQVSSYRDVSLGWAAMAALLFPLALVPLGFEPGWFPGLGESWEAAHLASRNLSIGQAIAVYSVLQAVVFITVFLVTCIPVVRRWVTPRSVRRSRVRRAAMQQFLAHGLHMTEHRTGVLIFAALSDHQVEVIADAGIHARVDRDTWAQAVDVLTEQLRAGRAAQGFEAAIQIVAEVLSLHFPPGNNNIDELPNRLVEL